MATTIVTGQHLATISSDHTATIFVNHQLLSVTSNCHLQPPLATVSTTIVSQPLTTTFSNSRRSPPITTSIGQPSTTTSIDKLFYGNLKLIITIVYNKTNKLLHKNAFKKELQNTCLIFILSSFYKTQVKQMNLSRTTMDSHAIVEGSLVGFIVRREKRK